MASRGDVDRPRVRRRAGGVDDDRRAARVRVPRLHRGALVGGGERGEDCVARVDVGEVALDDLALTAPAWPHESRAASVRRAPTGPPGRARPRDGDTRRRTAARRDRRASRSYSTGRWDRSGVRRARARRLGALRGPGDVSEPGRRARRARERRADGRLPDHGSAGLLRRVDRVRARGTVPRVEVAQALPRPVPRRGCVLRGARRPDPRRRRRGAPAGRRAGDRPLEQKARGGITITGPDGPR